MKSKTMPTSGRIISRWLDSHREDLSTSQISILEEWMAFVRPELYVLPKSEDSMSQIKELEALTMHWVHARRAILLSGDRPRS
jgi:hypothetical protein